MQVTKVTSNDSPRIHYSIWGLLNWPSSKSTRAKAIIDFSYEDIAFSVAPASTSSHSSGPSHCVALAENLIQTYSRCAKSMFLACMQYNKFDICTCVYIYIYIYMCVCVYVCILCIYIYIYKCVKMPHQQNIDQEMSL